MSFDFEPISNRKEEQNMKNIHSFMSFAAHLQTIVKTFHSAITNSCIKSFASDMSSCSWMLF